MDFVAVLNKDIDLGKSLNALAHLSIGLGHKLQGIPNITVYFGDTKAIREFRTCVHGSADVLVSDFIHTMTEDTAVEQLARTKSTAETELTYFCVCAISPRAFDGPIAEQIQNLAQVEGYQAYESSDDANLLPPSTDTIESEYSDRKLTTIIAKKHPLAEILNPVVETCLSVGRFAKLEELRLLDFVDKDNGSHPGVSYHGFPILTVSSSAKHRNIVAQAESSSSVVYSSKSVEVVQGKETIITPIVTTVFGSEADVQETVPRKATSLFKADLSDVQLV